MMSGKFVCLSFFVRHIICLYLPVLKGVIITAKYYLELKKICGLQHFRELKRGLRIAAFSRVEKETG